ncbi:MAG: serine/threonine protein kinase [Candidatus Riflebacteria bacterium]|nr:serine/threonine protein kinase [Candidatus Riflebacteria bacterium]
MPEQLDKYRLEETLGEGGMARVYRATDTALNRPVAVKVMKLGLDEVDCERFLAEARALSRLRSPHLLEVLDFGETGGAFYFVMPFVQVMCLADLVTFRSRQGRTFDQAETAAIGLQMARALEEAHRHNLIHRDVKPQNILISPGVALYLTDFGIVRDLQGTGVLTQVGTVVGTPRYMAPEQIRGEPVDFSTDLYSLGLVLFELVTGRLPGEIPGELAVTLRRRLEGLQEPLATTAPAALQLSPILETLLVPAQDRRYRSAAALAQDLAGLAGRGEALSALAADVRTVLGAPAPVAGPDCPSSPWTLMGIQANPTLNSGPALPAAVPPAELGVPPEPPAVTPSAARRLEVLGRSRLEPQPPAPEGGSAARRLEVPPLAKPQRAPGSPAPRVELPRRLRLGGAALALAALVLLGAVALVYRGDPAATVTGIHLSVGFQKLRLEWNGEAKELSLVTPRGHEELYEVRGRQQWESGKLFEPGVYSAALVPLLGEPVPIKPFDVRPFDPATVPVKLERAFRTLRVRVSLPLEATVGAVLRGEGLSVSRTSSSTPAREQTLELDSEPFETASLLLTFSSRLGEEARLGAIELLPLPAVVEKAVAAVLERVHRVPWKAWYSHQFSRVGDTLRLGPETLDELASLGLDAPLRDLVQLLPEYLESRKVPLQARAQLYEALTRLQDPYFFCERYGLSARRPACVAMPATWATSTVPSLATAPALELPMSGIMSFKPRFPNKLSSFDLLDDVTRIESKEVTMNLTEVAQLQCAELMLETWALNPELAFTVTINDRLRLEFRNRGQLYRQSIATKQTIPIYHRFDPAALVEGQNLFRIAIRALPSSSAIDSAALNSARLLLSREPAGAGSSLETTFGRAGPASE